jgi:hypothetical protein
MRKIEETTASETYARAHAVHYEDKNLGAALDLYVDIMSSQANAPEAEYARAQVMNIVNKVVSKDALLIAQIQLARSCLEHDEEL